MAHVPERHHELCRAGLNLVAGFLAMSPGAMLLR
jgi:hypothetical protein